MRIDVSIEYTVPEGIDPATDKRAQSAVGRPLDFSGCFIGGARDLGWECKTVQEAERVRAALIKSGFTEVFRDGELWGPTT